MNILHFLDTHPFVIGLFTIAALFAIFYTSRTEREQLRRGNTKYLRRASDQIKAELDGCKHEWHLESVRIMIANFFTAYGHTIQGKADYEGMQIAFRATKWNLERDSRYIDEMNTVMLFGQNLMVDGEGHLQTA